MASFLVFEASSQSRRVIDRCTTAWATTAKTTAASTVPYQTHGGETKGKRNISVSYNTDRIQASEYPSGSPSSVPSELTTMLSRRNSPPTCHSV